VISFVDDEALSRVRKATDRELCSQPCGNSNPSQSAVEPVSVSAAVSRRETV
jgi:hypothetical protein